MADDEQVDVIRILNSRFPREKVSYNKRDLILYSIGIGLVELKFTYELHDDFAAFPLYPVVLPFKGMETDIVPFPPPSAVDMPEGMPVVNPAMILHAEQSIEVYRPLDPNGATLTSQRRILSFLNKRTGTLMETETILSDDQGPVVRLISGAFIRGLTGFQGRGRKTSRLPMPSRSPDVIDTFTTSKHQALIYRLSGDYNPLHIDPEMAASVGFHQPLLHGLCTMGFAAACVYRNFCGDTPEAMKSIRVRFVKPCFPGETLVMQMWRESNRILFRASVQERQVVVLDAGEVVLASTQPQTSKL